MYHSEETIRLIMGLKIRHLREERGLTLSELAQRTGISISYLNEIEKGKKHPKPSKAALIAEALATTYDKLVSLQLDKKLQPIAQLLQSNLLHDLQLEHFGLDKALLLENFAAVPDKLTAILSTIGEIARRNDINLESFYLATLRTYQEMHHNYFPELEKAAESLMEQLGIGLDETTSSTLFALLQSQYGVATVFDLETTSGLASLRSLMLPRQKLLRVNSRLSEAQLRFVAARELAFQYLQVHDRPLTSAWVKIKHFEEVLNNFKASYVAGAMLLPQDEMVEQLQQVFGSTRWQPQLLEAKVAAAAVSPEMYLHRATSILPKFFGIRQLFFLKFEHDVKTGDIQLTKELHLGGLHNPHAKANREHYCGRWVSIALLHQLAQNQQQAGGQPWLSGLQKSRYAGGTNEYLVVSMARSFYPSPARNSSISIGMFVNDALRDTVKFLHDEAIPVKTVSNTCERCPLTDCEERQAAPHVYAQRQVQQQLEEALSKAIAGS
ncbi:MAG: helix-turn-helix domain-containing protein [Chitinophagaceae bacterium]|nr:helix-turn-helix domain-containing protein [Chitinophagaceae bacterium]